MTFDDYQQNARANAVYPQDLGMIYPALGLAGGVGEVVEHIKKTVRDDNRVLSADRRAALEKEIGDVLWYLANLCADAGLTLEGAAATNLRKIRDRRERGVLHGAGDNR